MFLLQTQNIFYTLTFNYQIRLLQWENVSLELRIFSECTTTFFALIIALTDDVSYTDQTGAYGEASQCCSQTWEIMIP